ncbi:MAG: hypothetical protein E7642_00305 [Ruminococcaceae bacterium]|nr:hypothetical protein [Oscillospiraceae bacterium]
MSAIGGIADMKGREVSFSELDRMRASMSLRGRKRSNAYIGGSVDMIYNSSLPNAFDSDEDVQPAVFERGGYSYALSIDSEELHSHAVFEKYRLCGIDMLGSLGGGFALALYDGERKILLLARDKYGKKPLFYQIHDGKIYFSSELKGIFSAIGQRVNVSREILSLHMSAPMGVYRATNIFCDVCEVLAGECVIFGEFGMSRFRYRENRTQRPNKKEFRGKHKELLRPYPINDVGKISETLNDALIAFDYPQFDVDMPSLCELFEICRKKGKDLVRFEDNTRSKSISYAYERQDRLGALFGISAVGASVRRDEETERYSGSLFPFLRERFFSLDASSKSFLVAVMGEKKLEYLMRRFESEKNKDTEAEVRILGMLCQCVEWARSRELAIRSGCDDAQSALSMM